VSLYGIAARLIPVFPRKTRGKRKMLKIWLCRAKYDTMGDFLAKMKPNAIWEVEGLSPKIYLKCIDILNMK
jgi:hypothetical protein